MAELKRRKYSPVYLLTGEETLHIDAVSDYIAENVLEAQDRAFNQIVLYGKDTDVNSIIFAVSRPPMMAKYQVVIVKEAQHLKLDAAGQEKLLKYMKHPLDTTILVICMKGAKHIDRRSKLYLEIKERGTILETVNPYDNEIPGWISNHLKQKGASIDSAATAILAEHLGNDLNKIVGELDKLFILLPENSKTVTVADIEKNIGINKDYNVFELGKAVFTKNVVKANRIIRYFGDNPNANPMVVVISSLFTQFLKLFKYQIIKQQSPAISAFDMAKATGVEPFFLREYDAAAALYTPVKVMHVIALLREYDMKSKGWNDAGTPDHELMKELVFKIMH
jgi:DNA polymerase-3 subunit delta